MPHISILIPAFNATRTLPGLVEHLLAQAGSRYDIEIVISPDDDSDYPSLLPDDPRITYAPSGLMSGPGVARTRALNAASGDHVTWIDADDWVDEGYIASLHIGLEHHTAFAVRPEYRRQGSLVRRLNVNRLDAKGLSHFYGSIPVVAPRDWLTCFPDTVAEDVIASMRVLRLNAGTLPVVNAGYHFLLNQDSFCAQNGALFSCAYSDNLNNLEALSASMGGSDSIPDLKLLFESRLAMSIAFDEAIAGDPGADYHLFVLGRQQKPIQPYSGPHGRWY